MKKFIILTSLLIIICLLVACSDSTSNDSIIVESNTDQTILEDISNDETIDVQSIDLVAIVDEIISKVEWSSLSHVENESIIEEFFMLDPYNSNYNQLLIMQCPMSAVVAEIILIDAVDVDTAIIDLNARRKKLIDTDTYYPEHKEIAEQSIVGNYGNIVYFIAGENAEDSQTVLLEYLESV